MLRTTLRLLLDRYVRHYLHQLHVLGAALLPPSFGDHPVKARAPVRVRVPRHRR
jgi:hypothetical protein